MMVLSRHKGAAMSPDEQALHAWFDELARCVNATDFQAGRKLVADDIVSFGTFSVLMHGLEDYITQQWHNVWPNVQNFRFHDEKHIRIVGDTAWAVCTWDSEGINPDGSTFERPGRATMVFEKRHGQWVGVHSHFSLFPKRSIQG
jgi:ketosteroid isomerase-like protein